MRHEKPLSIGIKHAAKYKGVISKVFGLFFLFLHKCNMTLFVNFSLDLSYRKFRKHQIDQAQIHYLKVKKVRTYHYIKLICIILKIAVK